MKKKSIYKKQLIIYAFLAFAFVNLMLPFKTYTKNGNTEVEQLTAIAYANSEPENPGDPENPEDPVYKPFGLWDWIISLTD